MDRRGAGKGKPKAQGKGGFAGKAKPARKGAKPGSQGGRPSKSYGSRKSKRDGSQYKRQDSRPSKRDSRPSKRDSRPSKRYDSRPSKRDSRPSKSYDSRPSKRDGYPSKGYAGRPSKRDGRQSKGPGQDSSSSGYDGRRPKMPVFKRFAHQKSEPEGRKSQDGGVFDGVYKIKGKFATRNLTPKKRVYGEKLTEVDGVEYRIWDPHRSKVCAALAKGLKELPIGPKSNVLYLGASSGTTPSHISDICETIYCVEFSKRMMRELLLVTQTRPNMVPVLADARHPWEYENLIGPVDVLVQDVAQPDQAQIVLNNFDSFGFDKGLLSIKARSINSVADPKKVFQKEIEKLRTKFDIVQQVNLAPFEEDHTLVYFRKK